MKSPIILLSTVAAACIAIAGVASAAESKPYKAPRNEFGQPNLQGTWTNATLSPVERSPSLGDNRSMTEEQALTMEKRMVQMVAESDKPSDLTQEHGRGNPGGYNVFWFDPANKVATVNGERRTSLIVEPANGRVPAFTPSAQQALAARNARLAQGRYDGPEQGMLGERCILGFGSTAGPPMLPVMYNANYQIVQSPDNVVILVEMVHDARVIRLGGQHPPKHIKKWMGDSIGRWEGETLVVETTNFDPRQPIQIGTGATYRSLWITPNLKVIERFTRTSDKSILYQFTVEDPETFTQTWRGEMPLIATDQNIYEYACHEGNYALPGILAGAREDEKNKADSAAKKP
jgi:hypothetical protein